ncbi:MAG: hypothetical protein AB9869_37255 [Verrucomicrobiia bacterium]
MTFNEIAEKTAANMQRIRAHLRTKLAGKFQIVPVQATTEPTAPAQAAPPAPPAAPVLTVTPPAPAAVTQAPQPAPAYVFPTTKPKARTWTAAELKALCTEMGIEHNLAGNEPEAAQVRHLGFLLNLCGVRVPGLAAPKPDMLSPISKALLPTRQAAVDRFLSRPRLSDEQVLGLGAAVFSDTLDGTLRYAQTPERQTAAITERLQALGVRVEGIPSLSNLPPSKLGMGRFQARADAYVASLTQRN